MSKMVFTGTGHLDPDDYWDGLKHDRAVEDVQQVALNAHQFGGQGTLFHAPIGQPEGGLTTGNPHARLYRTLQVPGHLTDPKDVLDYASQKGVDGGHERNLGIHWSHRLDETSDLAHEVQDGNWGRHGPDAHAVIIEADHPGREHIIDASTHHTPPEGMKAGKTRLQGDAKDFAVIRDTVGPYSEHPMALPEVPVRPGAPMRVHAVHMPHPEKAGEFVRNPVQFKGIA